MNDLGGLGAIWWSSIAAYADRIGIVGIDALERFVAIIKAMDGEYRDFAVKQAKRTQKK
ncbi:MAG: hypothetical protein J0H17_18765 [Rhizobiales bacterium]|nr:hypothetical protein [Hyphomicrobiales bacterium]